MRVAVVRYDILVDNPAPEGHLWGGRVVARRVGGLI